MLMRGVRGATVVEVSAGSTARLVQRTSAREEVPTAGRICLLARLARSRLRIGIRAESKPCVLLTFNTRVARVTRVGPRPEGRLSTFFE